MIPISAEEDQSFASQSQQQGQDTTLEKKKTTSPKVIDSLTVRNISTLPLRDIISMLHAINGLINAVDDQRHEPFFQKLLPHVTLLILCENSYVSSK